MKAPVERIRAKIKCATEAILPCQQGMKHTRWLIPFLGLMGCDGVPAEDPVDNSVGEATAASLAPPPAEYVEAIKKIKADRTLDKDKAVRSAQERFGLLSEDAIESPRSELVKPHLSNYESGFPAPTYVWTTYSNATQLSSNGIRLRINIKKPGNIVRVTADAIGNADPMLFLIQFDDPKYKATGVENKTAQNTFKIHAWNDDTNGLSSSITWNSGAEAGYFSIVSAPWLDSTRGRTIIRYTQTPPDGNCGVNNEFCDSYTTTDPNLDPLGGGVVRAKGDFFGSTSTPPTHTFDPVLYAFKVSQMIGVHNDNNGSQDPAIRVRGFSIDRASVYDFVYTTSTYGGQGTVAHHEGIAYDFSTAF
ncbi:MAG: hypothetical protein SGI86_10990 [Deltaproteobacteria bacterium]|nr:hypothetical protein [Deltaproteobacteria bacterium]